MQFKENLLASSVKKKVEQHGLDPKYLELEITESMAMKDVKPAIVITRQLKKIGVEISIDDFGTGYSSLAYLQQFSLHKLKIDQSFVQRMTESEENKNIVITIINLAKNLHLKTIAEGVETKQQLELLKQNNCDEIQGYYYSKPLSVENLDILLKQKDFFKR